MVVPMAIIITDMIMTEKHDWHSDPVTRATVIDSAYRNTQNVRRFFKAEIGARFNFDRPFIAWMKSHKGSTMGEAAAEWRRHEAEK